MENMINKLIELSIANGWDYEIEGPDGDDEMVLYIDDKEGNDFIMSYDDEGYSPAIYTDCMMETAEIEIDSCWIGWAESGTIQEVEQYEVIEKILKNIFVG